MQILFCDNLLSVRLIYYAKLALNILRFLVPILLIIKISLDIYKAMMSGNFDEKAELVKKESKKIIAALIIFIVPTFVNLFISFMGTFIGNKNLSSSFTTCYTEANSDLLAKLEQIEESKLDSKDENEKKNNLLSIAKGKAFLKDQNEKLKQKAASNSGSSDDNGSYNSNLTDENKQNMIYVKNGVFYKPKYVEGKASTYSGKHCPSNPTSQGYNNKYGYNNHFYTMLENLVKGAKAAGYNLRISTQGCRSFAIQQSYYKSMAKGRAAHPGRSNHGWGIASDVGFYKNATSTCGSYRTYSNCPGMKWVHEHAKDYGLRFPLLNASYKEDWHIEPMTIKTYNV